MLIHELDAAPPPELQRAIEAFEATFLVPYAPGRFYRISYGSDRTAFVRTLGEGKCYAAERDGRIIGFLEIAVVSLLLPDGATRPSVYIADLKMLPEERKKLTTARMLQRGVEWGRTKSDLWFTVTMDGAPVKPPAYTGRAGIAALSEAGRMAVVRLPVDPGRGTGEVGGRFLVADAAAGREVYKRLARGRYAILGGSPGARSSAAPAWMVHPSGQACGRFEDRRNVRRLIADDGSELRPAYLSCFSFKDPRAAVELIATALDRASSLGCRALRISMPPADLAQLRHALGPDAGQGTQGAIFATATAKRGAPWNLNAAEI